jgi:hypothetical protein
VQTKLTDDSIDLNRIFATKPVAFIRTRKKLPVLPFKAWSFSG